MTNVCGECNAGWMSGLEVSFRQAVFAKSRDDRVAEPTRRTLSRWFAKTAMLVADASDQELVPEDHWPELTKAMPRRDPRWPCTGPSPAAAAGCRYSSTASPTTVQIGKLTGVAVQVDNIAAIVTRRSSVTPATTLWPIRSHVLRWTTLPVVNRLSDVTGG